MSPIAMSLRYQIIFRVLLLSGCILLLGGAIAIWQARQAVGKEVDASVQLVLQLISSGLVDASMVQQDASTGFAALRQTRHLSIEIKQADGRLIHLTGKQPSTNPESLPPAWFIRAVQGDYRRVEHHLHTRSGEALTLVIQAQPLDEISEVWEESLGFFASISLLTLLTFVAVNLVLNKSLRAIAQILDALQNIEAGDYSRKLPAFSTHEFDSIACAINHMSQELDKVRLENRALTQHSLAIQEDERQHLAQELHDEFGQSLTAIKVMSVTAARRNTDITDISATVGSICDHLMTVLRTMMQQLHPLMLSELGLKATLEDMVIRWMERHPEMQLHIECGDEVDSLEQSISIQLFRVIQECLTNVLRHAEAKAVVVQLKIVDSTFAPANMQENSVAPMRRKDMVTNSFPISPDKDLPVRPEFVEGWAGKSWRSTTPDRSCFDKLSTNGLAGKAIPGSYSWRNPKLLLLSVKDDGHGCELTAVQHGFGLRGMRERIRSLDGELQIVSSPGSGMLLTAWVPLA